MQPFHDLAFHLEHLRVHIMVDVVLVHVRTRNLDCLWLRPRRYEGREIKLRICIGPSEAVNDGLSSAGCHTYARETLSRYRHVELVVCSDLLCQCRAQFSCCHAKSP